MSILCIVIVGRVPDSVALVGEHHENDPRHRADYRRQNHEEELLVALEGRIEALHGVGVQEGQNSKHHKRE